jgi:hypothetical protein
MLYDDERIPMTAVEAKAFTALKAKHKVISITRRDPGESGPVLVHLEDGTTLEMDKKGKTKAVKE